MIVKLPVSVQVGLWMAVSAVSFSILLGMVRHLAQDLDVLVITFWRNCAAAILFIPWMLRVGVSGLKTERLGLHIWRALFLVASSVFIFYGVVLMPLAEATAISFTTPLFATLFAVLFLGEFINRTRILALIGGFIGVMIMLRPGMGIFDIAALIVIASALTFAMVVITGKMLTRTESPTFMVAFMALLSIPISLGPALFRWEWPGTETWPWLIAMGVLANLNMYSYARALKIGDASLTQPFDFIRLPATAAVGYIAFQEWPDMWVWIGGVVVFASAIFVGRRDPAEKT